MGCAPVKKMVPDTRTTQTWSAALGKVELSVLSEPLVLKTPVSGPSVLVGVVPATVAVHLLGRVAVRYLMLLAVAGAIQQSDQFCCRCWW